MTKVALFPPSREEWLRIIPSVEKCCLEMELLMNKYGGGVFAIANTIFYENMEDSAHIYAEQMRFQNSRWQDSQKMAQHFRGTGVTAADGGMRITDNKPITREEHIGEGGSTGVVGDGLEQSAKTKIILPDGTEGGG